MSSAVRFVQISDTHISPDPDYRRAPDLPNTADCARALVAAVNALPFQPDFILHTGDVAYDPDESAYVLARDIFAALKAPVYYLPGNHDDTLMLQRILIGTTDARKPYELDFEVNGVRVVTVDSHQPVDANMPYSRLHDTQLERVRAIAIENEARPLLVATHHNVLPIGAAWWDDYMRMQNGDDLHAALLPARGRLLAVLHGHVHQPVQIVRDGIPYISAASAWMQLLCAPDQVETGYDEGAKPGFNVGKVMDGRLFLRQYTY
jgi:3',5'-cyclic-AMP phosphodiesterase